MLSKTRLQINVIADMSSKKQTTLFFITVVGNFKAAKMYGHENFTLRSSRKC